MVGSFESQAAAVEDAFGFAHAGAVVGPVLGEFRRLAEVCF